MLYKQNIKQVHRGCIFLAGEISSPQLALSSGSLLAHLSLTQKNSFQALPSPCRSCTFLYWLAIEPTGCEWQTNSPGLHMSKGVSALTCHPLMAAGRLVSLAAAPHRLKAKSMVELPRWRKWQSCIFIRLKFSF